MADRHGPGRPPLATAVHTFHITLSLREGVDDDLIAYLSGQPLRCRARAVIAAMRQGGVGETAVNGTFDEAELLAALDDLLF
jgi:hypothetical protein